MTQRKKRFSVTVTVETSPSGETCGTSSFLGINANQGQVLPQRLQEIIQVQFHPATDIHRKKKRRLLMNPAYTKGVELQWPMRITKISDLMTTLLGLRARRSTSSMEIWSTLLYTCKRQENDEEQRLRGTRLSLNPGDNYWHTYRHGM